MITGALVWLSVSVFVTVLDGGRINEIFLLGPVLFLFGIIGNYDLLGKIYFYLLW